MSRKLRSAWGIPLWYLRQLMELFPITFKCLFTLYFVTEKKQSARKRPSYHWMKQPLMDIHLYQAIYVFPALLGVECYTPDLAMAQGLHRYIMLEWVLRYNPKFNQTHLNISQVGSRMEICSQPLKSFYYLLGFVCIRDATGFFLLLSLLLYFHLHFQLNSWQITQNKDSQLQWYKQICLTFSRAF